MKFCQACERNKAVILAQLQQLFADRHTVLEIGSGSGQHAQHFSRGLPHLLWQPSEIETALHDLAENLNAVACVNLKPPILLNVNQHWPALTVDAVFSANVLHIISWHEVEALFEGVGRLLSDGGKLVAYGPFRYCDDYTSASNAEFDRWLKQRDAASGIRDFEAVDRLACEQGLTLLCDRPMPANNQLICWYRPKKLIPPPPQRSIASIW